MKAFLKVIGPIFLVAILVAVLVPGLLLIGLEIWGNWHDDWSGYSNSEYISDGRCNIATIPIVGDLATFGVSHDENGGELLSTTMSETLSTIGRAEKDPFIAGILLLVDSSGGSPSAGMMIAEELKHSELPSAAFIFDIGASSAYLAASGAGTIIATPLADIGSIGLTMSYLQNTEYNTANGQEYIELTSAKFKDAGSPDRPLSQEEIALFKRDLDIMHGEFVDMIAKNRSLPKEEVEKLADGSTLPAKLALEKKLIDGIGNKETVREWLAVQLELTPEQVIFCQ